MCKDHVLDLNTGTTREHSPEDYATSKLPFNYDPKAKSAAMEEDSYRIGSPTRLLVPYCKSSVRAHYR